MARPIANAAPGAHLAVDIRLRLQVLDESALRRFVKKRYREVGRQKPHFSPGADPETMLLNEAVGEALVFANANPRSAAYGISVPPNYYSCVRRGAGGEGEPVSLSLRLRANVFDESALWSFALARYRKRWGHSMGEGIVPADLTLASAVLHALIFSGDNPDERAFGVAFTNGAARLAAGTARSYSEIAVQFGEEAPTIGALIWGYDHSIPLVSHWITVVPPGAEVYGKCQHEQVEITFYQKCCVDYLVGGEGAGPTFDDYDRETLAPFDIRCLDCPSGGHFERLDLAPPWVQTRYRRARACFR